MSGEELISSTAKIAPGAVLAQAREALGVTQREVSDALNLPITTIDAIESEDKERLPAHVFTRGYVRAYAKLLEVDPDPLVAAWAQDHHPVENTRPLVQALPTGAGGFNKRTLMFALRNPRAVAGLVVAVVVVIVLVWTLSSTEKVSERSVPGAEGDEAQIVERGGEVASDADGSTHEQTGPQIADEMVVQAQATVEIDGSMVRRLTSSGADRLTLQFVEECWVEIKDAEGNVLFGDLGQSGQSMHFIGAGPFRVLLGYAPGAELSFNAEPIALAPHTRNNVANLVLGQ